MISNVYRPTWALLALSSALAAPGVAGDLSIFAGNGIGQVLIASENGPIAAQPTALTGIRLLPLEFTLHSPLDGWDSALPQTVALPGGATAVRIPGQGAVYAYQRVDPTSTAFGLFRVRPDGQAEALFERIGTGPASDVAPFHARLAVAPGNDAVLIATTPEAGGDLLELDLNTLTTTDRTANQLPLALSSSAGLVLTHGAGFAAAGSELVRFDRVSGAVSNVALSTPSGAATQVPGDLARSADGHSIALIAGNGAADEYVFVVDATGLAARVTDLGATISGGGYLPEIPHGPFFALSADGSHVGWRTEVPTPDGLATTTEGWLKATGIGAPAPASLTNDNLFLDTLDEIAPFAFYDANRMLMGVGELDGTIAQGVDATDLFTVTLDAGGQPIFENQTLSSGDGTAPFLTKPLITPGGMRRLPGTDKTLVQDENLNKLLIAGPGVAPIVIEARSKKLRYDIASGSHALLVIERDEPFKDLRIVRLDMLQETAQTLAVLNKAATVMTAVSRGDGWIGATLELGLNQWTLGLDLASGLVQFTIPQPFAAGPTLDIDANGDLLLSSGPLGTPALFARDPLPGFPSLIGLAPTTGFILPR